MSSEFMHDVTAADFDDRVVKRSHVVPVLVDFWATWCGPCRVLQPTLERLASEMHAQIDFVEVEADANQELLARFNVRSVPTVKIFVDGRPVDEFLGALPEAQIREFLRKNCPSAADRLTKEASALVATDELAEARSRLELALANEPDHPGANLLLARLALRDGNESKVEEHLSRIAPLTDEAEAAKTVREALQFLAGCREAGGEETCRERVRADADDLESRLGLGACLATKGAYREALEEFLAVASKDRDFRDGAARKAMLTIFGLVGVRSELADEYRRKLMFVL